MKLMIQNIAQYILFNGLLTVMFATVFGLFLSDISLFCEPQTKYCCFFFIQEVNFYNCLGHG